MPPRAMKRRAVWSACSRVWDIGRHGACEVGSRLVYTRRSIVIARAMLLESECLDGHGHDTGADVVPCPYECVIGVSRHAQCRRTYSHVRGPVLVIGRDSSASDAVVMASVDPARAAVDLLLLLVMVYNGLLDRPMSMDSHSYMRMRQRSCTRVRSAEQRSSCQECH